MHELRVSVMSQLETGDVATISQAGGSVRVFVEAFSFRNARQRTFFKCAIGHKGDETLRRLAPQMRRGARLLGPCPGTRGSDGRAT